MALKPPPPPPDVGVRAKKAARFIADVAVVFVPVALRDGLAIAAGASIAYGCDLIYRPAGFIAGGALALAALAMNARAR